MARLVLAIVGCLLPFGASFAASTPEIVGDWVSKGQVETRTLHFSGQGKGEFVSMHTRGSCSAGLESVVDQTFAMASGTADHCQQRDNAVAFEFYCQLVAADELRCKIRSTHVKSGNVKSGLETFVRQ